MPDDQPDQIEKELEALSSRAGEFIASCQAKSCFEAFGALRERAARDGYALYYIHGTFFQLTQAPNLLDFHTAKERAIKLISLFQRPEECFKIQPNMPEDVLEYLIYDLSSCVYENLADAAGQMEGFNSKGLHDSISGGIQICRSTGKVGCIQCFREYAGDVYLAADDPDLARHQCQVVIDHEGGWQGRGNRRWLAMMKMGWIEALQGNLELAQSKLETALEWTKESEVNVPLHARFDVMTELDAVRICRGLDPLLPADAIQAELPTKEESPLFALMREQNEAMCAAANSDFDTAEEILTHWDRRLFRLNALHLWFETRLRLLTVKRLAGHNAKIDAMAKTLEDRATTADDWLTLRRLNEVVGGDQDPALLGVALRESNVSTSTQKISVPREDSERPASPFAGEEPVLTELLEELLGKIREAYERQSPEIAISVMDDLLAIDSEQASTNADTCAVLNAMTMVIHPELVERATEIWRWANRLASRFRENGVVISLLAKVGNELRMISDDPEEGSITPARIEQLFRKSLDLEKNGPQTYARAGDFFLDRGEVGEAEKCFARSFKLDRQNPNAVLKLAEIYSMTDRPRDALQVLDLCLREGSRSERVAWEAAMAAFGLRQFKTMLNYLSYYEELAGEQSPIHYYKGVAWFKINAPEEALGAIERERATDPSGTFHCDIIEFCARAMIGQADDYLTLAIDAVRKPARELDYIPTADVDFLFETLWLTFREIKVDRKLQLELEQRMLACGMMPDEYFDIERMRGKPLEGVRLFRILIEQKLDDAWADSPACFAGQEHWTSYFCEWGVLAKRESEARKFASRIQSLCYDHQADVVEVATDTQTYVDVPGIIWQGARYSMPEDFDFSTEEFDDQPPFDDLDDADGFDDD